MANHEREMSSQQGQANQPTESRLRRTGGVSVHKSYIKSDANWIVDKDVRFMDIRQIMGNRFVNEH